MGNIRGDMGRKVMSNARMAKIREDTKEPARADRRLPIRECNSPDGMLSKFPEVAMAINALAWKGVILR